MLEMLVEFGSAVKTMADGSLGGYLVLFGTPESADSDGEFFTKSTDFSLDVTTKSAVLYNHALDPTLKGRRLGIAEIGLDDVGVWIKAQLDLRDDYERAVYDMAKSGKLGWSSGSAAHLVEKKRAGKAAEITRWPLGLDASLTPTPADPRNRVMPLKSWQEQLAEAPDALKTTFDTPSSSLTQYDRPSASRMPQARAEHDATVQRVVEAVGSGNLAEDRAVAGLQKAGKKLGALLSTKSADADEASLEAVKAATDLDDVSDLTLAQQGAEVVSTLAKYAARLETRQAVRVKVGRSLSQATISEMRAARESILAAVARYDALLEQADPPAAEPESKAAPDDWLRELVRFEEFEASQHGVPLLS